MANLGVQIVWRAKKEKLFSLPYNSNPPQTLPPEVAISLGELGPKCFAPPCCFVTSGIRAKRPKSALGRLPSRAEIWSHFRTRQLLLGHVQDIH